METKDGEPSTPVQPANDAAWVAAKIPDALQAQTEAYEILRLAKRLTKRVRRLRAQLTLRERIAEMQLFLEGLGKLTSPPPAFEEGVASVAPGAPPSADLLSRGTEFWNLYGPIKDGLAPGSPPVGPEGAASVAPLDLRNNVRLACLENENQELRTGEPGSTIGKLQDELRAVYIDMAAEEAIREGLTERLEEQNALLDALGLGEEASDSREAISQRLSAIGAPAAAELVKAPAAADSVAPSSIGARGSFLSLSVQLRKALDRLARLDALLASEEVPEGLAWAIETGLPLRETAFNPGDGKVAGQRAWRWFREQLGEPAPPPLDSVAATAWASPEDVHDAVEILEEAD